jgi:mannonate dehydratase
MRIAMCLEDVPNIKWHLAAQMGVTDAVAIRWPNTDLPIWDYLTLARVQATYADFGFALRVIEGWVPMDAIRLGSEARDIEMERLVATIRNMGALGIEVFCYNWMARHNWLRTSTTVRTRGGALTTSYSNKIASADPAHKAVPDVTEDHLWGTLARFLEEILPVAEEAGVKLAMHPDDPPLSPVFGTGRIMRSVDAFERLLSLSSSPSNGLTFCQGNFCAMGSDIPAVIRQLGRDGRIHFVHFRDVRGTAEEFTEVFHDDGPTDMYAAMEAYRDIGFSGVMRPDHAPVMYGEANENPGYESLGRLFAVGYMRGLIEGVENARRAQP